MITQNLFGESNVSKPTIQKVLPTPLEVSDYKPPPRRHTLVPSVSMLEEQKNKLKKTVVKKNNI